MKTEPPPSSIRFTPCPAAGVPAKLLIATPSSGVPPREFRFFDHLEIGRDEPERPVTPGLLLLRDPSISWRHCVLTQDSAGHCLVRDLSRNGTRVQGRRLVPNVESPICIGEILEVGKRWHFRLEGQVAEADARERAHRRRTVSLPHMTLATVLVGDIRDYTVLVRNTPAAELQQSVSRLFERLTTEVIRLGGTVKEFQGDAMVAFWEQVSVQEPAKAACAAAIQLDRLTHGLARDRSVWALTEFPLELDWALSTGMVAIDSFGGDNRLGLSLVGEPIVMAFRLEKFACHATGRILACRMTQELAAAAFTFTDLGEMQAKGFDRADRVFALVPECP